MNHPTIGEFPPLLAASKRGQNADKMDIECVIHAGGIVLCGSYHCAEQPETKMILMAA